jgi:hypothetical protein
MASESLCLEVVVVLVQMNHVLTGTSQYGPTIIERLLEILSCVQLTNLGSQGVPCALCIVDSLY